MNGDRLPLITNMILLWNEDGDHMLNEGDENKDKENEIFL